MRKLLLLLCILSITISAKAQLFGKHWDEGSYYDLQGVKHSGLISWEVPKSNPFKGSGDNIYYKINKKADQSKIKWTDLQSFIVGVDSFIVTKNETLSKYPFLKVMIPKTDTTKLYCSMITKSMGAGFGMGGSPTFGLGFSYAKKTYYFGSEPNSLTKLDKKNFIEVMSRLMADKPEAVERIKSKKLRLGDMEDLLYFYANGVMPPVAPPDPFSGSDN